MTGFDLNAGFLVYAPVQIQSRPCGDFPEMELSCWVTILFYDLVSDGYLLI